MSDQDAHPGAEGDRRLDKGAVAEGDRNVEQIRDILFGGHMRDYERRFGELGRRLELESERLREEVERRFAALDARLDDHVERLGRLLKQEAADRIRQLDDLESRTLSAARTQREEINAALSQLAEDLARRDERARASLASLSGSLDRAASQAEASLAAARTELRLEKVGREDLSALFTELALRLKGEFELPARK
ncbi:MAG: hypothetical protein LW860_05260 [Xanthomonadaceae bacterium]|jgi:hypothetical protein|nr:hypothetical protein [Xanthomonadaceae bacterium]